MSNYKNIISQKLQNVDVERSNSVPSCSFDDVSEQCSQIVDNYSHVLPHLVYVETNIPGPGCEKSDFEVQLAQGCNCQGDCSSEITCECIGKYGQNYKSKTQLLKSKFNGGPVMECNSVCKCNVLKCLNRCVQFGPHKNLEVIVTDSKGYGLKTTVEIKPGDFICEYAGEVIGLHEAKRRFQADASGMNYIFVLNEHLADGNVIKTCVDPAVIGNIGRYINHSCEPNAAIVPVRVDCLVPKLCIFALKTIPPDNEITFNYGGDFVNEQVDTNGKICLCKEQNCKKYLPFDKSIV